ncbi:hypothetical protein [Paenibacillus sp. 843]|uniref:hypothetical protein n=1 Tax=Paenibacillus sp. 843 TaxID=3341795 RepID=UPI0037278A79
MQTKGKVLNWRRIGGLLALTATLVLITVWAQDYYSKKVFYMEGLKYAKYADSGSGSSEYRTSFGRGQPIYVHTYAENKRVEIAGEVYEIRKSLTIFRQSLQRLPTSSFMTLMAA